MTLFELFGLMRKHLGVVIALPVAFALATAAFSFAALADTYTAEVSMYVLTKSNEDNQALSNADLSASQMLTNDVATLIKSSRVRADAAKELGVNDLRGYRISVDSSTSTRVLTLRVTGASPSDVTLVANQIAKTTDQIAQDVMEVKSINVIDSASEPKAPSGPPRLLYTLVAFLVGLFVAVAAIAIADMVNTRVRSAEEAAELVGLSIIGRIPVVKA